MARSILPPRNWIWISTRNPRDYASSPCAHRCTYVAPSPPPVGVYTPAPWPCAAPACWHWALGRQPPACWRGLLPGASGTVRAKPAWSVHVTVGDEFFAGGSGRPVPIWPLWTGDGSGGLPARFYTAADAFPLALSRYPDREPEEAHHCS